MARGDSKGHLARHVVNPEREMSLTWKMPPASQNACSLLNVRLYLSRVLGAMRPPRLLSRKNAIASGTVVGAPGAVCPSSRSRNSCSFLWARCPAISQDRVLALCRVCLPPRLYCSHTAHPHRLKAGSSACGQLALWRL